MKTTFFLVIVATVVFAMIGLSIESYYQGKITNASFGAIAAISVFAGLSIGLIYFVLNRSKSNQQPQHPQQQYLL
tara:strand:- start:1378 stop:1602 length:225 start_codon:yes stop_codon:yes gene_type:complete